MSDICWALVLGGILQFVFNKDRGHISRHKELDIEGFSKKVKFGDKGYEHRNNVGGSYMAVGSLKSAMNHVLSEGIEKKNDKKVIHLTIHLIYIYKYIYIYIYILCMIILFYYIFYYRYIDS